MIEKLAELEKTHEELTARLADPAVIGDRKAYTQASKALAEDAHAVTLYRKWKAVERERQETEEMLQGLGKDDDLYAMAQEERARLAARSAEIAAELKAEMAPKDRNDARNVILEIRAGTGGDEATLF